MKYAQAKEKRCKCGCGRIVTPGKTFIKGHNMVGHKVPARIKAKISKSLIGHTSSRKGIPQTAEANRKNRLAHLGKKASKEARRHMSLAQRGKRLTKSHRKKIAAAHIGMKASKLAKKHISMAHKGKKLSKTHRLHMSLAQKGSNNPFYGKEHTAESKKIMSKKAMGREISESLKKLLSKKWMGKRNPNYVDGKANIYPVEFRRINPSIRKRDKYICQECHKKQGKRQLDVHHIDYNEYNNKPTNLISLCHSCHVKTNGTKNRKQWTSHFIRLMKSRGLK